MILVETGREEYSGEIKSESTGNNKMIKMSVMYPQEQGKNFNLDYYLQTHMALVKDKWSGLVKDVYVTKGLAGGAPNSPPSYHVMAQISFASMDDLQEALGKGADLFADIPNFTDIQPVVQISEQVYNG